MRFIRSAYFFSYKGSKTLNESVVFTAASGSNITVTSLLKFTGLNRLLMLNFTCAGPVLHLGVHSGK